eukprot:gene28414-37350_t
MAKKENSKGNASTVEKTAKADVKKSAIAASTNNKRGKGSRPFGQPAIIVALAALLFGLYSYYQVSIQSLFETKSPSNLAPVNNSKIVGNLDIQEQVKFSSVVSILNSNFSTLKQCLSRSASGECINTSTFENDDDTVSIDGNTMLHTVEGEELVDLGTTVVVPKGANQEGRPREAVKDCVDRYPKDCLGFVKNGECDRNPGWMIINCAKSCNACHLRDPNVRCGRRNLNMSEIPIYKPGDMESMFSSIESRFGKKYGIEVISRSPWVVTLENFLSDREAAALISTVKKWERSTDTGLTNEFGETGRILSNGRTSSNSWCTGDCEKHPDVRRVLSKIEAVTGVPKRNYESFQVLKYETGQKYNVHHDYGKEDVSLACGPRILTFFLYLSDVEEGGETAFPSLGIAVKPKKGKALLWPSTLSDFPEDQDARTFHEARPVIKGLKYAANSWIHMYDYEKPNLWGCTGSFDEL